MRKPWVAGQYVYANQVVGRDVPGMGIASEIPKIEAHGFLKTHVFVPENLRTITEGNRLEANHVLELPFSERHWHAPAEELFLRGKHH